MPFAVAMRRKPAAKRLLTAWLQWALVALVWMQHSPAALAEPSSEKKEEVVAQAEAAWKRGDYARVRAWLTPLAVPLQPDGDPLVRERIAFMFADSVLQDPGVGSDGRTLAEGTLNTLLDQLPDVQIPRGVYTPATSDLFAALRTDRARAREDACQADLVVCRAEKSTMQAELDELTNNHHELQKAYNDQEVEVRSQVARSRFWAAIPFGVGHFYNQDKAFGFSFLAAELALGGAGLGLLIYRVTADGCRRTRGFSAGSLQCNPRGTRNEHAIVRRRRAEEGLAWAFAVTAVFDVVLAQIRFRKFKTESIERIPRRDLPSANEPARRKAKRPRASVRPHPIVGPDGASLSVHVDF